MVTAQLYVLNKDNQSIQCRGLLDTCSTTNFMTSNLADVLQLKRTNCHIPVGALNSLSTFSKEMVTATIKSKVNNYEKTITFLIVPTISERVPDQPVNRDAIKLPNNIKLADPYFHRPTPVDLLLGAGTTLSLLSIGQIIATDTRDLYLQKTLLGWIIGGAAPLTTTSNHRRTYHLTSTLDFELSKFWEIEECPGETKFSAEEVQCEEHFQKHVRRNLDGRYVVALPFNAQISKLGESYQLALKRLENTERKLSRNPTLANQYNDVIKEYIGLGHMSLITNKLSQHAGYYLPHHAVFKESSMTTKVRVVFDGSAKTTSGVSLNDTLLTGPTIQSDLFSLLIRFRKYSIVLTGDIEKMYRQFLVRNEDRKYQRVLWRDSNNQIQEYELNTVTFGLTPAPYLAIRCLHQLANDEGQAYSRAAEVIKQDFYVDDVLTGANTPEEAINLRQQLTTILSKAGLTIRQWASNDTSVLDTIPRDNTHLQLQLGDTSTLKTLGIYWNSINDTINYSVKPPTNQFRITKRLILSETAKIFDPLGLLAPVIITAKIILQKLWRIKVHWDESLPGDIHSEWLSYYNQLPTINNLSFPRTIITPHCKNIQIHGFADASQKAYGACLYLRTVDMHDNIKVQLLCAKSRVAPLKAQTIPKLELCGAQLLANLIETVMSAIQYNIDQVCFWIDSMIVLHWLNTSPHRLKTFVSNRVAEIQRKTDIKSWYHVRTKDNPADLVSRGIPPSDFISSAVWRVGPSWLSKSKNQWPSSELGQIEELPEQRQATCFLMNSTCKILERFSSMEKLLRVLSYCYRFKDRKGLSIPLTVHELQITLNRVLKLVQYEIFSVDIKTLREKSIVNPSSQLIKLHPFIDDNGLLRVGGRLEFSNLPYESKHPVILPKNHHVTQLLINQEHQIHLHAGVQQTLYALRRKYWLIDGRSQVFKFIKKCVKCCKIKPPPTNYLMGNLPQARVTHSQPFTHVGIDFCGPFILKEKKFRNRTSVKSYVAVFVCLAVKAIHLELVTDLTTAGFLAALRRFISRRGFCQHIYSDNGRTFVGANNSLKELNHLFRNTKHQEEMQGFLVTKNIQWHFIPPQAPHVGGLWEAAVKSFKKHLKYVAGRDLLFTYEQFNTLIIEIEAILNSRPLTPLSSDPNDPIVLTPGHFLIGDSLTNLHGRNHDSSPVNQLSTWQHIQRVKQHFWKRWKQEYLNELTPRTKWSRNQTNISTGAVVLLREDHLPPAQWALGRVVECHPGSDGVIRTATIKTATTVLTRNIKKLVILPVEHKDRRD